MALDKLLSPLLDLARAFVRDGESTTRPSQPPPPRASEAEVRAPSSVAAQPDPATSGVSPEPGASEEPVAASPPIAPGRAAFDALLAAAEGAPEDDEDDGLARDNEIVAVRVSESDILLSWNVEEARVARGRKLAPDATGLSVRLVLFHRGSGVEVVRQQRERAAHRAGEWLVADVPRGVWMTASIGLVGPRGFVSLAHSTAARAP